MYGLPAMELGNLVQYLVDRPGSGETQVYSHIQQVEPPNNRHYWPHIHRYLGKHIHFLASLEK